MHNIIKSDALTVLFYHLVIDVASHEEVSFSMVEFSGTFSLSLENICHIIVPPDVLEISFIFLGRISFFSSGQIFLASIPAILIPFEVCKTSK